MTREAFDLSRFLDAQDANGTYARALSELRAGAKQSHWMWFVFPQLAGLKAEYHCEAGVPVIDGMWKTPEGAGGPEIAIGPTDTVRFVTNDFMLTGGDGYTAFAAGTDVQQPGDDLMQVTVDYITANSPVAPVVEGRIVGP